MSIMSRSRRSGKPLAPAADAEAAAVEFEFAVERDARDVPPALFWDDTTDADRWELGPEPTFVLGDDDQFRRVPPILDPAG